MTIDDLHDYIAGEILNDAAARIAPDQDLLLSGTLDSLGVTRLVAFIEDKTDTVIPAEDVTLENFATLEKIAAYVAARTA